MLSEFEYSQSTAPPLCTGQGAFGSSFDKRGSASTGASSSGSFDPGEPFWNTQALNTTNIAIRKNSLSQFSAVADQKRPDLTSSPIETGDSPCSRCSLLCSRSPVSV